MIASPLTRESGNAGIWANHANRSRQCLEPGDIEEALRAAAAVGDDTIQRWTLGRIAPESFTHGSAEQRGTVESCDTFRARN
ncbi:MAG: neutral zinc metallopeptidase [Gammaproteobacteria bacterium]|nr:neutral zinc metallopeptidase [Gammaproteobacteria bacterium]